MINIQLKEKDITKSPSEMYYHFRDSLERTNRRTGIGWAIVEVKGILTPISFIINIDMEKEALNYLTEISMANTNWWFKFKCFVLPKT
jgi:hypothetical protein